MGEIKDKLRALTVGAKKQFARKKVLYKGEEFEVKQPSQAERQEVFQRCRRDENGGLDKVDFAIWSVILLTFVPGTDERVFSPEDYEGLLGTPAGGFVDHLSNEIWPILYVNFDETEKN
ncbi:MAG: hypothetical protein AB1896_18395 [Thermodesulfobacteriota bacterium]